MGLIKAVVDSAKTTLADQWIEYFYCDTLSNDVLVQRGYRQVKSGSNTKGSDNIITDGSGIAVNEGQAVLIVEDGKIVDFSTEAGRFTWSNSSEPSLFSGGFNGLVDSFKTFGKRFTYGGTQGKDQRVYYVNMKEIFDNKFGSQTPMAYNDPTYRGIYIRYFGSYTFKIVDPILFYSSVAGNVHDRFTKAELLQHCDLEFISALDEALAKCSDSGYQYNDLPKRQREIAIFMNDALDLEWRTRRGMEVESVAIGKVTPDDESRKRIQLVDDSIMMSDARIAAGRMANAQANALEKAASNEAGAFTGFMGFGMANNQGGQMVNNYAQGLSQDSNNPLFNKPEIKNNNGWTCSCGQVNDGNFCSNCGSKKIVPNTWTCSCGKVNDGNFCSNCGSKKPTDTWTCECGQVNDGNFCSSCGKGKA